MCVLHAMLCVFGLVGGIVSAGAHLPDTSSTCILHELQKIIASDAAEFDAFGGPVAIHGRRAIVAGGLNDDACPGEGACDSGSAYVLWLDDNATPSNPSDDSWIETAKLTASDAEAHDWFGMSVSIHDDRAVVGALYDDDACPGDPDCDSGAAYVFRLDDNDTPSDPSDDCWKEEVKLTAWDAAAEDYFGWAASVGYGRLIVGACADDDNGDQSGSAYIFRREDNGTLPDPSVDHWVREAKLTASDGASWDLFGISVAMSPGLAIIGAGRADGDRGAVYIFRLDDNDTPSDPSDDSWAEEAKLRASDGAPGDWFGRSVSISGPRVLVGCHDADVDCPPFDPDCNSGAAYVFRRDDNGTPSNPSDDTWAEEAKLIPSDPGPYDWFGRSVSISGGRLIVGATLDDDMCPDLLQCNSGAAYLFQLNDGGTLAELADNQWLQVAKLMPTDLAQGDAFGRSAINGVRAIVGSCMADNEGGVRAGSAYFFDVACGCVDLTDYARLQRCFSGEGGMLLSGCEALDFDADEDVDLTDLAELVLHFKGP